MSEGTGVVIPEQDGRRSSSALGRAVVSDALAEVDPVGASAALRESNWRHGYPRHFHRLVEAGLPDEAAAVRIATDGLDSLHRRMRSRVEESPGLLTDRPIWEVLEHGRGDHLHTASVSGSATPETSLSVPYRGSRLAGRDLAEQLDRWLAQGLLEPGAAEALRTVMANPDWLALPGHNLVALGAAAELSPVLPLLRWGATVTALDLPAAGRWRGLLKRAKSGAGTLRFPVSDEHADPLTAAGADVLHDTATVVGWLAEQPGPLVLGNYVYADGTVNLRLATAVDAVGERLRKERGDLSLAFLATPTDVFAVPGDAVEQSVASYDAGTRARFLRTATRKLTAGRLLRRNYRPGSDPGINDSVIVQQGPNYLLAKRIHRWRATVARRDAMPVSLNVAPPTRTRSVTANRTLAAAYAGAHRFGLEIFPPDTSQTLMAALLVHDLHIGHPLTDPWREEARQAVHGGLWRGPYDPRSALGLALVLGIGGGRS